jgi:hypothetical protein
LAIRALDSCPVFVGTAASSQERQVNQLDGNPLIPVGFGRVGQLKKLARSFIRISEGSISGEFHGQHRAKKTNATTLDRKLYHFCAPQWITAER